jgi:DNA-binding GntR family transcriptional regulator
VDNIDDVLKDRRLNKYVGLNQKFHFTIYEYANSPRLLEIIQDLWGQVGSYMNELFKRPGFEQRANDEHKQILKALKANQPEDVHEHLVADITTAAEFLMPHITELASSGRK